MLQRRTFGARSTGRLGKRATGRMELAIGAGLKTTGQMLSCRVDNVSRDGCCLHIENPPSIGDDVVVRIERAERFGRVAWIRNGRCGVRFDEPLSHNELARLRWIIGNPEKHAANTRNSASAMWR